MTDLWIPKFNDYSDTSNLYDMMLVFQEQLDEIADPEDIHTWHSVAIGALRMLSDSLISMDMQARQVNVATSLAIVAKTEDPNGQWRVENVGLRGSLSDVHCVKLGQGARPAFALALDVEAFYPVTEPDSCDTMLTTATAPISQVHYVEHTLVA